MDSGYSPHRNQLHIQFLRFTDFFFRTIGSADVSFSCTRKKGAVLSFPVSTRREDTLTRNHFREWIITHIDSWFSFTQKLKLGIEMEDIVLVTGYHRTRSWSNIAFNEVQTDAQFSIGVDVAGALGVSINWRSSDLHIQGALLSQGPSGEVRARLRVAMDTNKLPYCRTYLRISAYLFEDFESNEFFSGRFHESEEQRNPSQIHVGMTVSRRKKWFRYPVLPR